MKIGIAGPIETETLKNYFDTKEPFFPKGLGGTPINNLIKELIKKGNNISVYSLSPEINNPVFLEGEKLKIFFGPYRYKHRMRDLMKKEIFSICDFIIKDNPEIVHAHWSYEFALGALFSLKPVLITFHDWAPKILYLKKDAYRFGRLLMNFITIIKGKHFSVVSPYLKNYLQKYVKKDIPVIPNGLSENMFIRSKEKRDNKILAINNGFSKLKNIKVLLKAYQLIRHKLPMYSLYLIGEDYEHGGIAEKWSRENNLHEGVFYIGSLSHEKVLFEMSKSKLLIHTSLEESFGMVLVEAMAQKIPIIGGNNSGAVPWILDYGNSGILVNIQSPLEIAQQAIKLLSNDNIWSKYSEFGFEYAKKNFLISKVAEQYLINYKYVMESSIIRESSTHS